MVGQDAFLVDCQGERQDAKPPMTSQLLRHCRA
jgi:hypothetical protein